MLTKKTKHTALALLPALHYRENANFTHKTVSLIQQVAWDFRKSLLPL